MFFKKLAAMFAAVFGFAASLVTVYAGDNSIAGPVMWLLIGSGVLIVAVVVLSVLGKKKKKEKQTKGAMFSSLLFSSPDRRVKHFWKDGYRSTETAVKISLSSGAYRMVTRSPTLRITAISLASAETA